MWLDQGCGTRLDPRLPLPPWGLPPPRVCTSCQATTLGSRQGGSTISALCLCPLPCGLLPANHRVYRPVPGAHLHRVSFLGTAVC